ncbi:hypothetical protein [Streptomyces longwoodensis]|uniref:hypothetical protein n=1 Tax=Streptomyces longwoodensis TaxID=68231 RepID=UPI0033F58072
MYRHSAAEFPDPGHPVHRAVVEHRAWFLQTVTGLFADITPAQAEHAGRHFVMLRDGAMSAGYLGDPVAAGEALVRGIEGLLRVHVARRADQGSANRHRPTASPSGPPPSPASTARRPAPDL